MIGNWLEPINDNWGTESTYVLTFNVPVKLFFSLAENIMKKPLGSCIHTSCCTRRRLENLTKTLQKTLRTDVNETS